MASFEKQVGRNGRSSPSSPSNARWSGCRGAGACQALTAEGGGRKARLYKGQASPATIATSGPMGCDSRPRASRQASRSALHHPFEIQKSQIFAQPVGRSRPYSPELSSSRARSPSVFVGSCRSLARLGCQRCAKRELAEQTIPVKRVVLPTRSSEDIAGPAVFLASDLSVYVTGHIIRTDGGYRTV